MHSSLSQRPFICTPAHSLQLHSIHHGHSTHLCNPAVPSTFVAPQHFEYRLIIAALPMPAPRPRFSAEQACELLRAHFGVQPAQGATPRELPSYDDQNWLIDVEPAEVPAGSDGSPAAAARVVLKIHAAVPTANVEGFEVCVYLCRMWIHHSLSRAPKESHTIATDCRGRAVQCCACTKRACHAQLP